MKHMLINLIKSSFVQNQLMLFIFFFHDVKIKVVSNCSPDFIVDLHVSLLVKTNLVQLVLEFKMLNFHAFKNVFMNCG